MLQFTSSVIESESENQQTEVITKDDQSINIKINVLKGQQNQREINGFAGKPRRKMYIVYVKWYLSN